MEEHGGAAAKHKRAGKVAVRVWAWTLGALSFLSPMALLGLSPRPAQAQGTAVAPSPVKPKRPVIIIVTRKIIKQAPRPSVSSSGGGGVNYVYAPTAAPAAVSCGSGC